MNTREGTSESSEPTYITKKVVINGQTVTLYSQNGHTWLSTPDQIPDVMARLDNTRVLLNDGKGDQKPEAGAPAAPAAKPTAARYRLRGPKPRPILQPDGSLAPVVEREPVSAADTEVTLGPRDVQIIPLPADPIDKKNQKGAPDKRTKLVASTGEIKGESKREKQKPVISKKPALRVVSGVSAASQKTAKSTVGKKTEPVSKSAKSSKAVTKPAKSKGKEILKKKKK